MKTIEINSIVLAYLGDSVYENYVRLYLIKKGINHVKDLQEKSLEYVSAKSQARILKELINENFFSNKEIEIIKRARNTKTNSHPKNTDIITYKEATSLEALIGYLKLENNIERIEELMNKILKN
ncbi:MAG: ribonuclease III [Bacilli bacterium]|nr:ribonuclease III [Bacilli bacterium]